MNIEDSINRIKADAFKLVPEYWNCSYIGDCSKCHSKIDGKKPNEHYGADSCFNAMVLDLIERTVKVMERSIERTCNNLSSGSLFVCSECNGQVTQWNVTPNFCPNCGAKVVL